MAAEPKETKIPVYPTEVIFIYTVLMMKRGGYAQQMAHCPAELYNGTDRFTGRFNDEGEGPMITVTVDYDWAKGEEGRTELIAKERQATNTKKELAEVKHLIENEKAFDVPNEMALSELAERKAHLEAASKVIEDEVKTLRNISPRSKVFEFPASFKPEINAAL